MFSTLSPTLLTIGLLSSIVILAACLVTGLATIRTAARHPVAVADVLGRSGRVRLGIIAAGAIGILIAWLAEHGLPAEAGEKDAVQAE